MTPDIQKQLKYHMLARQEALRGLKAIEAGKRKDAIRAQVQAESYLRLYRKYGGMLDLT